MIHQPASMTGEGLRICADVNLEWIPVPGAIRAQFSTRLIVKKPLYPAVKIVNTGWKIV